MSKPVGVDAAAARKVSDALSEFKLPDVPEAELLAMSEAEWMERYGDVLQSERWFEARDPDWAHNRGSWWFRSVGRDGPQEPLWMRQQYHLPELDCPEGRDRHRLPVDARKKKPLWAERMGLSGSRPAPQSATIYGHRREYRPAEKTAARSMYERYQPGYERLVAEELPDVADPADGRFWAAGVAQGVTTHPYEKRIATSGRRKPIVAGPRSISVVVDGESHTLANAVRDFAWLHPAVEFAAYSAEHPVYRHVNMRVQTSPSSGVGGEQALAETLELVKATFGHMGSAMAASVAAHPGAPGWAGRGEAEEAAVEAEGGEEGGRGQQELLQQQHGGGAISKKERKEKKGKKATGKKKQEGD